MRFVYQCCRCSSQDVMFDAYAEWDENEQEFVLANVFEESVCNECGNKDVDCVPLGSMD